MEGRGISDKFISELKTGLLCPALEAVLHDDTLCLEIRDDYINIYYTRSTGSDEESIIKTYKITDKFKITNDVVNISVTGYENNEEISITDINTSYSNFDSGKTVASCQNILFVGGTVNNYEIFKTLEK